MSCSRKCDRATQALATGAHGVSNGPGRRGFSSQGPWRAFSAGRAQQHPVATVPCRRQDPPRGVPMTVHTLLGHPRIHTVSAGTHLASVYHGPPDQRACPRKMPCCPFQQTLQGGMATRVDLGVRGRSRLSCRSRRKAAECGHTPPCHRGSALCTALEQGLEWTAGCAA